MEQSFIEKLLSSYNHLKRKYVGCFCKDQMDNLCKAINMNIAQDFHPKAFALINTGGLKSNGEHWMGVVINKEANFCRYFNSFSCCFNWLEEALKKYFDTVHKTRHVVQSETASTCGLHTIYFIVRMMSLMNKTLAIKNVDVGSYIRKHYDTKS